MPVLPRNVRKPRKLAGKATEAGQRKSKHWGVGRKVLRNVEKPVSASEGPMASAMLERGLSEFTT